MLYLFSTSLMLVGFVAISPKGVPCAKTGEFHVELKFSLTQQCNSEENKLSARLIKTQNPGRISSLPVGSEWIQNKCTKKHSHLCYI